MSQPPDDAPPVRAKISLTANLSKPAKTVPVSNSIKRRAVFGDDDDDNDEPSRSDAVGLQSISSFGVSDANAVPQERVIAPIPNKDWRAETQRKRQKSALPGTSTLAEDEADDEKIESGQVKAGLRVLERRREDSPPAAMAAVGSISARNGGGEAPTDEERAIAELKGETLNTDDRTIAPVLENGSDAKDTYDAPASNDMFSLARYDATPVDGFGSALLRGYMKPGQTLQTWKETQEAKMQRARKGKQGQGVEAKREGRRPDLLGIGAKEMDMGEKTGGSKGGKADFRKQKREQAEYAPVVRRNRETGEVLTEKELGERAKKGEEMVFEEAKVEKRKLLENGESRRERDEDNRRRDYSRQEDGQDRRDKDRRRDDRRERERYNDSDRDRHQRRRDRYDDEPDGDGERRHRSRRDKYDDYSGDDRNRRRRDRDEDKYDSRHEQRYRERSGEGHRHRR